MFLHFGLYSQLAAGEWVFHHHRLDMAEYAKLAGISTAEGFDVDGICALAKEAGCRAARCARR